MSVNRIITRLAAVCALNNFLQEPWPTTAGPNIFDSKIEPVEDMSKDKAFPCCVVYTDYDKDHWNKANGAHKDRLLTVTFELLVVQAAKLDSMGELQQYQLDCPVTDSEIEMTMDMFEAEVFRALRSDSVAAQAFNHLCPGVVNVISRRGASIEGGQRLAARQITLEMKTLRDQVEGGFNPIVEQFLERCETFSDYQQTVDEIRSFVDFNPTDSAGRIASRVFGYTDKTLDILGTPKVPGGVLPPNINYNFTPGGIMP